MPAVILAAASSCLLLNYTENADPPAAYDSPIQIVSHSQQIMLGK
jgi:hypothetical protein